MVTPRACVDYPGVVRGDAGVGPRRCGRQSGLSGVAALAGGIQLRVLSLRLNLGGCLLEGGVAGSGAGCGALGPSGAGLVGFRWTGGGAEVCGKSSKPSSGAGGGELVGFAGFLPGQPVIGDESAGEP